MIVLGDPRGPSATLVTTPRASGPTRKRHGPTSVPNRTAIVCFIPVARPAGGGQRRKLLYLTKLAAFAIMRRGRR
jgi:hypothetical protein